MINNSSQQSNQLAVHSMSPNESENLDTRIRHRKADVFCDGELLNAMKSDLTHGRVFSIYGTGGEGKSFFIRDIRHIVSERGGWITKLTSSGVKSTQIFLDFYDAESSRSHENLREIFKALSLGGIFCPRFSIAYHSYLHQQDKLNVIEKYLEDLNQCRGDSPFEEFVSGFSWCLGLTGAAIDAFNTMGKLTIDALGVLSPIHDIIEAVNNLRDDLAYSQACNKVTKWWEKVGDYDKQALIQQMPRLLKEDLKEYIQINSDLTLLFVVDSFEHLFVQGMSGRLSDIGKFICQLSHLPNTVWVIAGRRSLRGQGWDNVIRYPIELVDLGRDGTAQILADYDLYNDEVIDLIYEYSGGVPLFIDFFANALNSIDLTNSHPTFGKLLEEEGDRRILFERFVSNMEAEERAAVVTIAYLREWGTTLLQEVLKGVMSEIDAAAVAEEVRRLSFVTERRSGYQIHETIGEILRSFPPVSDDDERTFVRIYAALLSLFEQGSDDSAPAQGKEFQTQFTIVRALYNMSYHIERIDDTWWKPFVGDIDAIRMAYVSRLKALRSYHSAEKTLEQMMAAREEESDSWMLLRLELAATLSLISLDEENYYYHLQAICIEKDVYRRLLAQGKHANHDLLFRARNSLGTSHYRIAHTEDMIRVSLTYHQPNYDEVCLKKPAELNTREMRCLNNYGISCLRAARITKDDKTKQRYLTAAKKAFMQAQQTRSIVLGESKPETLKALTNLGIAEQEMGDLDAAEIRFRHIETILVESKNPVYPKGDPSWFYLRFHQAILEESFAQKCLIDGDIEGARRRYRQALGLHKDILTDRRAFHASKTDQQKSKTAVRRCKKCLMGI